MTNALDLFQALAEILPQELEREFQRRDICIFATRAVVEIGRYFQIQVEALPVKAILYNRAFAKHVEEGDFDCHKWFPIDGSHSLGIGFGKHPGKWSNHLIAVGAGAFGDFSISQAERLERGVITGPALVGPYHGQRKWTCISETYGTVVEYGRQCDRSYLDTPDWKKTDAARLRLIGRMIRKLKKA